MKIATWNVNSIAARLPVVLQWIESAAPDVLCLQEIKCLDEKFPREEFMMRGYTVETHGQKTYNGVAILSKTESEDVRRGFPQDDDTAQARMIAAIVSGIRIINVYVPNGQAIGTDKYGYKLDWLKRLRRFLDTTCDKNSPVLMCGDFNVAPEDIDVHDPKAWEGQVLVSPQEREALKEVTDWGFIDIFRSFNQEVQEYSWWDYRAMAFRRNMGLRIDHIWVTEPLAARCKEVFIDKEPRKWERPSDHTPVVVIVE
ncbi:MAG: exodeoxyribonuclease III [Acidobacteriota bacterium]